MMFGGTPIIWSMHALEATKERLFPESKHRSKRIRKKLIKRFGGEFRMRPCMFQTPHGIYAHPSMRAEFERRISLASMEGRDA